MSETSATGRTHLPVIPQEASSLRTDGSRNWVHPADVEGRFSKLRKIIFTALIGIYIVMPFIEVGGHPAVFLDIAERKFYLFGATFNAQDFWLAFFLLTGIGFVLIFLTAVLGRVWCGYACPQTVFLEGVYRRIERWIEGSRNQRIKRNAGPITLDKVWRKGLKHVLFVGISLFLAHVFLSYFVSLPALVDMVQHSPAEHPEAFGWMVGVSLLLYVNFAWFREQLCLIVCPYGRLQSVLTDEDSIIVGYDAKRGEPRGKATNPDAGDCVDCNRCVVVCPTGIDIRNGLQLDCIGCSACIDACDEVMTKLKRPKGLIRYDSLSGFEGKARRFFRPRLFFYVFMGLVGLVVASFALQSRTAFEANLLRMPGAPFVVSDEGVRNQMHVHLVNKENEARTFELTPVPQDGMTYSIPNHHVTVGSLESQHIPVFATIPRDQMREGLEVRVKVEMVGGEAEGKDEPPEDREPQTVAAPFLGPTGGP